MGCPSDHGSNDTVQCTPCDINRDGHFGPADYDALQASFGRQSGDPEFIAAADLDDDGMVAGSDHALFFKFCPLK